MPAVPTTGDGGVAFAGTVVMNGGAAPQKDVFVFGVENTISLDGGGYMGYSLLETLPPQASGHFAFFDPVDPATEFFVAQYDSAGTENPRPIGPDEVSGGSLRFLPNSSQALSIALDIETSTCFVVTSQVDGGLNGTNVLYVGANLFDLTNGDPLSNPGDLDVATAVFDAGSSPLPPDFVALGHLSLTPQAAVAGFPISNAWVFSAPNDAGAPLVSNAGTFVLTYSDSSHATPQFPKGFCDLSYGPPPGTPQALALNSETSQPAIWTYAAQGSASLTWNDVAPVLPEGVEFLGDYVQIIDGSGAQIYATSVSPTVTSPITLENGLVQSAKCSASKSVTCAASVTSFYRVPGRRNIVYAGGTAALQFKVLYPGG